MLVADLISREKDLTPYWNEVCQENSSQLWLPTKTVLQGLDTICSNTWFKGMVGESWYSMKSHLAPVKNSHKICVPSYTSFRVGSAGLESTAKPSEKKLKVRQVRFYPTPKQKQIFELWFEASRWTFNKAKELCDDYRAENKAVPSKYKLRDEVLLLLPERFGAVPYLIKAGGVLDYITARKNAILKCRLTGEFQEVGFRTRKNITQSFRVKPESVTKQGIYAKTAGLQTFTEYVKPLGECIFKRNKGRYVLSVVVEDVWQSETQALGAVVALDPGVRTFMTWYAGDSCGKIGDGDYKRIYRLCLDLDKLIGIREKSRNHRERRALKKASDRLQHKITDLITELHCKTAQFLVKNYDVILLPTFETSEMVEKTNRKVHSKTARMLLTFSHYKFKERLRYKANQYGKVLLDVNEAYTTRTVSWTGEVKNVGSAKVISSGRGKEKVVVDRDYNGARGILLRALRASSLQTV